MHKEKLYTLIKSPMITEKSARAADLNKQYVFKVDLDSNNCSIICILIGILGGSRHGTSSGAFKKFF